MGENDMRTELPDDAALIAAAEHHLRGGTAAACLVHKPGEDFVVVAGPVETVFSLIEEDIEFSKHNGAAEE